MFNSQKLENTCYKMIYDTTCADISAEFLNLIPGSSTEEKLVFLNTRLQFHLPKLTLQFCHIGMQLIVQVKGTWKDVQASYAVLDRFKIEESLLDGSEDISTNLNLAVVLDENLKPEIPSDMVEEFSKPGNYS